MFFKVTHIDPSGHRRKARVAAVSSAAAMDQMDAIYGDAQGGACVRMATRPGLFLVGREHQSPVQRGYSRRAVCGL